MHHEYKILLLNLIGGSESKQKCQEKYDNYIKRFKSDI